MTRPDLDQRLSALLKSVAPEPPTTLTAETLRPTAPRAWIRPALVTAAVLVVVLATFLVVRPLSPVVPADRSPAAFSTPTPPAGCDRFDAGATPIRLGADGRKMFGNPTPIRVSVATGSTIRVVSRFGERAMTLPAATSPGLQVLCTRHDAAGYQTYFRVLATSGTVLVISDTADCAPCIQMPFWTRVVVVAPPSGNTHPRGAGGTAAD